jgi:hypothetical protein
MLDVADVVSEETASIEAARAAVRRIVAQTGSSEPQVPFEMPWNNVAFLGIAAAFLAAFYVSHEFVVSVAQAVNF